MNNDTETTGTPESNFPPEFWESVSQNVQIASRTRQAQGYGHEFAPLMVLATDDQVIPVVHPQALDTGIDVYTEPETLEGMSKFFDVNGIKGSLSLVMLISDEYGMDLGDTPSEKAEEVAERVGPLADAFEAGNAHVREQLGFYVIDAKSRRSVYLARPYRFIPSEGWSWDAPVVLQSNASIPLEIELALNSVVDASL